MLEDQFGPHYQFAPTNVASVGAFM